MFKFLKGNNKSDKNKKEQTSDNSHEELQDKQTSKICKENSTTPAQSTLAEQPANLANQSPQPEKRGFFSQLKSSLQKTRHKVVDQIATICLSKKEIDAELLENLETILLAADIGINVTNKIISELSSRVARNEPASAEVLTKVLSKQLKEILAPCEQPLIIPEQTKPFVIFMVGINGAGKTTTIGKLANIFKGEGKKVMLAAGDTFRAAAIEQLQTWGERNQVPVISQHTGADSASVIFDAFKAAQARGYDILLADTAGRLHTKDNLMEELKKVIRVIKKLDPSAPHEVLLVLDASIGQNAIAQAEQFHAAAGITGIALTKLDGTAKGGVIFAIAEKLNIPLRYLGLGEKIEDLKPFNANDFVDALFSNNSA